MVKFDFPGDIHFVTARTFKAYSFFKDDKCCQLFLQNLNFYRNEFDLKIYGYCIMPDHVHLLVYFDLEQYPELTISKIVHGIKSYSSKLIYEYLTHSSGRQGPCALPGRAARAQEPELPVGRQSAQENEIPMEIIGNNKKRFKVWQPGFYDFNIYTTKKFDEKLEYIHSNPVKSGIVDDISQYKYCSWINYENEDHSVFKINYFK